MTRGTIDDKMSMSLIQTHEQYIRVLLQANKLSSGASSLSMVESGGSYGYSRRWFRTKNVAENGRHQLSIELPPSYQALSPSQ
jgi:hypothetical protein